MLGESYRTISREACMELIEKRSRFLTCIRPVSAEAEALELIEEKRRQYWDASHNVYAYILRDNQIRRYSDDGEPQGTAGLPMLEVLQKTGLCDCAAVVTRYFGGVLLGKGGLVRAYSDALKLAVEKAGCVEMRLCDCLSLCCAYAQFGWVEPLLLSMGACLQKTDYREDVMISFYMSVDDTPHFVAQLKEKSAGTLSVIYHKQEYHSFLPDI